VPPGSRPDFALTPTGQAHAELYPQMITDFHFPPQGFCEVEKVYATTTADKVGDCGGGCVSATNAFDTAKPLALAVMSTVPITTVGPVGPGAYQLYEYLGNEHTAPTESKTDYFTDTAIALHTELVATANRHKSSAIFWTSQGLHVWEGSSSRGPAMSP
jgi:hypothetical protein